MAVCDRIKWKPVLRRECGLHLCSWISSLIQFKWILGIMVPHHDHFSSYWNAPRGRSYFLQGVSLAQLQPLAHNMINIIHNHSCRPSSSTSTCPTDNHQPRLSKPAANPTHSSQRPKEKSNPIDTIFGPEFSRVHSNIPKPSFSSKPCFSVYESTCGTVAFNPANR